jgi:hypothetical protein
MSKELRENKTKDERRKAKGEGLEVAAPMGPNAHDEERRRG